MRRLFSGFLSLIGLTVVLTVYFFVPVGRNTLYEHTLRIAATEPAQELGDGIGQASEELGEAALREWEARRALREEAAGGDDDGDDERPPTFRVHVDDEGRLHIGDEAASFGELSDRIRDARRHGETVRAVVDASHGAPHSSVVQLIELLEREDVDAVQSDGAPRPIR